MTWILLISGYWRRNSDTELLNFETLMDEYHKDGTTRRDLMKLGVAPPLASPADGSLLAYIALAGVLDPRLSDPPRWLGTDHDRHYD